jgi:hypothetical protein
MIALKRLRPTGPAGARAYCELDKWAFDPRYTLGRCPICGWEPAGVPSFPRWMSLLRRVDWDLFGLLLIFDILVVLGLVVARAGGLLH